MANTFVLESLPSVQGQADKEPGNYRLQRIYIFSTRQGIVFAGLLIIMLFGAINYSNSMAYVLTFLLGSLLMICMLHTYRNLRGLIIDTPSIRPVFAGEYIHLPLLFNNRTGLKRVALSIEPAPRGRTGKRQQYEAEPLIVNLEQGKLIQDHLLIRAEKRGYLKPGRLKILSTYPMGLLRSWTYIEPDRVCTVYPAPAGNPQLPFYSEYEAEEQKGKQTGTDDFTGFKPYRHGDSIRNIDWKAFAREQPLQVKRFSGSGASKLMLRWTHCSHGDDEKRLSQLCLWIIEAEKEGCYYGLDIPGTHIEPGYGEVHMNKCLATLAGYGFTDAQ